MVVAVTNGLTDVKNQLMQLGYDVVNYGEYNMPIDAVVYSGAYLATSQMSNSNFGTNFGVLMVNATNKSISEIESILKRRTYTPLF